MAGGEVLGRIQHVHRHSKRELGRETRIMRAVSSHDCTYVAVVVRSSPYKYGGGRLAPLGATVGSTPMIVRAAADARPSPRFSSRWSNRWSGVRAVSYTHLDVYKRQRSGSARPPGRRSRPAPPLAARPGSWGAGRGAPAARTSADNRGRARSGCRRTCLLYTSRSINTDHNWHVIILILAGLIPISGRSLWIGIHDQYLLPH